MDTAPPRPKNVNVVVCTLEHCKDNAMLCPLTLATSDYSKPHWILVYVEYMEEIQFFKKNDKINRRRRYMVKLSERIGAPKEDTNENRIKTKGKRN